MRALKNLSKFRPYYYLLARNKKTFLLALMFGMIYSVLSGAGLPYLLHKVLPKIFGDERESMSNLAIFIAIMWMPIVMALKGLSSFFNVYYVNYCGLKVLEGIRVNIFSKLQTLPLRYFQQNKSGDILSRLTIDTHEVKIAIVDVANDLIRQPILFISAIGSLTYLSLQRKELSFILICLLVCGLCMIPIRVVSKRLLKKAVELQSLAGDVTASITESIQSPKEIRCYNLENIETDKFRRDTQNFFYKQMKVIKYSNILTPLNEFIGACGVGLAIAYLAIENIPFEEVVPLLFALHMCNEPIKKFGDTLGKIQRGTASLDRLNQIILEKDELKDPETPMQIKSITSMEFKDMSFQYEKGIDVLKNINIKIEPREVVALVGPSGSGKSTFINLIPRLYDPSQGEILLSGHSLKKYNKCNLRQFIAIVSQDSILFNNSIIENIRIGNQKASDEEVIAAAKLAYADEFIQKFEHGYHTHIGEKGLKLSGGQKQRLSLARAIIRNAPILVLDEATSALDSDSEEKIQLALSEIVKEKTVFMIAHRFSTLNIATRILVFDKGEIVGDGPHENIYNTCGLYKRLYDAQEI